MHAYMYVYIYIYICNPIELTRTASGWRAALFANTPILSGLRAVAAGSCGFVRRNK